MGTNWNACRVAHVNRQPGPFRCGATYYPSEQGPYLWHEFRARDVADDMAALRRLRLTHVRVMLSWEAFVPTHRSVDRRRLHDVEVLLDICAAQDLLVVPVLFAQSLGDSIMLPPYAIRPGSPRRGVRVVSGGVPQLGGPRDIWADPLMLEVQDMWLAAMLGAFGNHPAIAAWDLGHDPATTVRPRLTAHVAGWLDALTPRVRAAGDRVWLTLDADDVLGARAVRLGTVARRVDAVGLQLFPARLGIGRDGDPADAAAFTVQLAQRLCGVGDQGVAAAEGAEGGAQGEEGGGQGEQGAACELIIHTGAPSGAAGDDPLVAGPPTSGHPAGLPWDTPLLDQPAAAREVAATIDAVASAGAGGAFAWSTSDWGERTRSSPPADRRPSLSRMGLIDQDGHPKALADVWRGAAARERAAERPQPWPADLNGRDYVANLPESARDLFARWRGRPR